MACVWSYQENQKNVQVITYKLRNSEDITPHLETIESFYMNTFMSADMLMGQH